MPRGLITHGASSPMNKNLVICCSRSRPEQLSNMLQSFKDTSVISDIIILLDECDPTLSESIESTHGYSYSINKRTTTTELINKSVDFKYDYHCVTNDDFIYKTAGWDIKLIEAIEKSGKPGIAYGNDLLAGIKIPTTSIISTKIINAVGWLQMPTLRHLYGDSVWQVIGHAIGMMHYRDDVIIEHKHYFAFKSKQDDTYKHTNSKEMYVHDDFMFRQWLTHNAKEDINKVKSINE